MVSQTFPLTGDTQILSGLFSSCYKDKDHVFVLEIRLGVFAIQFALSGLEKMDFTQLLSNTQSDLKSLKKNLKGFDEESEKFCKFLSSKYDQVASWIIKKTSLENPQSLDKDELGQTLIPDDIILGEETRFLACKATGDGDCLFNSASRIVVGNESLCHLLRLLTILELYSYSNFYAKHPAFQEYLNAGVANGYDEDTLFTLCLTALGAATWDGKDRISAIKAEAEGSSKEKVWCGMFHFMALASVLGRPLYSVYPNAGSRVREFFHRKILPRNLDQGAQDMAYIMWSRDGALDSAPGTWYQPNHFIPIFRVPHRTNSNLATPREFQHVSESKPSPDRKKQTKGFITNFFSKVDGVAQKTMKRPKNEIKSESCEEYSKGAKTKKVDVNQGNSGDAVKLDNAKVSRNLTCATVERWKNQDLAQYDAASWLIYDSEKSKKGQYCTALKCKACIQYESVIKNRAKFSRAYIDGSTNFRLTNVVHHANSDIHKLALSFYNKQQGQLPPPCGDSNKLNQPRLDFSLTPQQLEDLKMKFDIAYFVVKEGLPLSKYEKLIALEKRHGVSHGTVYCTRTAATEFMSFQANEVLTKLTEDVAQSKFYSIMFDSTTDTSVTEQEAVFVLYFDPTPAEPQLSGDSEPMVKVKMGFLSIENLRSLDAQGVLAGIKRSLENLELRHQEGTPPTPIGLGGDGCNTNRGAVSGVQALFKREFPWFSFSWCVAHRLELALKDALTTTYFNEIDEVLLRLYYLYENSPKKLRGLYELHLAYKETFKFQEGAVKPKRATGTRWICHKLSALKVLVDKFGLFIQHLETLSCDTTVKSSDQSKLKGYLRKWKSGKLFVYSCFFVDLLQPAAVLSQTFQSEDVDAVTVSSAMSAVKKQLHSLQHKQVHKLQTVKHYLDKVENEEYQGVKLSGFANAIEHLSKDANSYIQLLNDAIETRLGGSSDIASTASLLNCEAWDFSSSDNESIDEVVLHNLSHFREPLKQQGLQVSQLQVVDEWHDMLDYTVQYLSPSSRHYRATWYKIFHSSRAVEWQNILLLIRLLFSLPVSNAALERMFSSLGRVKTAKRASLSQGTLQDILRIQEEGPPMDTYDPSRAVLEWDKAKRRRPNQKLRKVYKPRSTKNVVLQDDSSDELSSVEEAGKSLFRIEEEL